MTKKCGTSEMLVAQRNGIEMNFANSASEIISKCTKIFLAGSNDNQKNTQRSPNVLMKGLNQMMWGNLRIFGQIKL